LRATREKCSDENKNRWEALRSRVMRCGVKSVVCPVKGEVQPKVVRRTEAEKMTKEVKCMKCGRKGMNTVWIPEKVARGKMCPTCEQEKGKRIDAACPEKEEAQLKRRWWKEEEEARN